MCALPVLPPSESPAANCAFGRGCGEASAASPALPEDVAALVRDHPCYSEEAHQHFARMHVAVAPACNIQCNYCNRKYDCANESRPGVVAERLTPEAAVRKVLAVAAAVPELSVIGIAGPGDPLANPEATFATLAGVRRVAPDLKLCVSTNGLALPLYAERLADAGVRHVTVTVNMVDPAIGERIYPWIVLDGKKVRGVEASRILSERQLAGIRMLRARGVLVKINSVVIPGVNDAHIPQVVKVVRDAGAFLVNIVPLISAAEHGTYYGLTGQRGPTAEELERVQSACATDARLMRHCRQCRADAVGRLGQDRFAEFNLAQLPQGETPDAFAARKEAHDRIAKAQVLAAAARDEALAKLVDAPATLIARAAVATRSGGLVDEHFGHAKEFLIYDVSRSGAKLIGRRAVDTYCSGEGGDADDDALDKSLRALADCRAVLVAKIGKCPTEELRSAGIAAVTEQAFQPIEAALLGWFRTYVDRVTAQDAGVVSGSVEVA